MGCGIVSCKSHCGVERGSPQISARTVCFWLGVVSRFLFVYPEFREGNLEAAETMLVGTLKWRHEFKVDELKTETFPEDVFGKVGVISGRDKEGRPVTYNFYGAVDPNVVFEDVDKFIR